MPIKKDDPDTRLFDIPTPEGTIPCVVRKINSSNIEWVGWPEKSSDPPLMFVQFKGGSRYVYVGVTRQKAVHCAYADSTGIYLNERIKPKYEALKLR
jgi:KTSC domain